MRAADRVSVSFMEADADLEPSVVYIFVEVKTQLHFLAV